MSLETLIDDRKRAADAVLAHALLHPEDWAGGIPEELGHLDSGMFPPGLRVTAWRAICEVQAKGRPPTLSAVQIAAGGALRDEQAWLASLIDPSLCPTLPRYEAQRLRDISAKLAAGQALAETQRLVLNGCPVGTVREAILSAAALLETADKTPSLQALDCHTLCSTAPTGASEVLPGYIARGETTLLAGTAAGGKTILAIELAIAAVADHPFGGALDVPNGPHRVLVIDEEQGHSLTAHRVRRQLAAHDLRPEDMRDLPLRTIVGAGLNLGRPTDRERLFRLVDEFQPTLVIIDSLIRTSGGVNLDKSEEFAPWYAAAIAPLNRDYGAAVLLLHHMRKPAANDRTPSLQAKVRGSGDIPAAVSSVIVLEREPAGDCRTLSQTKCRWQAERQPIGLVYEGGPADPLRVSITGQATDGETVLLNMLADAGTSGITRAEFVEHLAETGIGGETARKIATRQIGKLYHAGRVLKRQEAKRMRLWLRDLAPADVLSAEHTLRGDEGQRGTE